MSVLDEEDQYYALLKRKETAPKRVLRPSRLTLTSDTHGLKMRVKAGFYTLSGRDTQ